MILQALCAYYDRLREDSQSGIAVPGFAPQRISFALVIQPTGKLVEIVDIRDTSGKKPRAVPLMVPEGVIRSANIAADFLWGNSGYVLGLDDKKKAARNHQTFEAFRTLQHEIADGVTDAGAQGVLRFLDSWDPQKPTPGFDWDQVSGLNLVFRLEGQRRYLHEGHAVAAAWIRHKDSSGDAPTGMCLVTGEVGPVLRLHSPIKGIYDPGGQVQKRIVSFNLDSFSSYGKEQNLNAPVSAGAGFAYTTALNHLLRGGSRQRLQIADATTVFWTERASPVEDFMGNVLDPRADSAVDAADAKRVEDYLRAVRSGARPAGTGDDGMRFYILGLSPNSSRIAVRFWYVDTVEGVSRHIGRHFHDIALDKEYTNQPEFPGIWRLLTATAVRGESDKVNPTIGAPLLRSVIQGAPYPASLLATLVERFRADHEIGYYRMAMVKAVLRRNYGKEELGMSLSEECTSVAYRLGRLFAVLEKAQQEAIPRANATIKDRFYGSASATPSAVFPQLIRMSQHHLAKLEYRRRVPKEKLIQAILDGVDPAKGLPRHLVLEDQGMFALGYYHQRNAFYPGKSAEGTEEPAADEAENE